MSTASGAMASSAATRLRAQPGPWWRTPKTRVGEAGLDVTSEDFLAAAVEVFPAVSLLDHRLEVLEPDDAILHRVLHDGAGQPRRHVGRAHHAVAIVGGDGEAVVHDRDRLGRRQRPARAL